MQTALEQLLAADAQALAEEGLLVLNTTGVVVLGQPLGEQQLRLEDGPQHTWGHQRPM